MNTFGYKKYFNLVEVALSIGILAIGVTSIMALFPVGFDRSREAIGENYCAEAADSLFAYIAREASVNGSWDVVTDLPTDKVDIADTSMLGDGFNFVSQAEGDIYTAVDSGLTSAVNGVYGIKVQTGDVTDFTGEVLLWRSDLPTLKISGEDVDIPGTAAVGINLEISWPVGKPYSRRKKNFYYFELFNSNS